MAIKVGLAIGNGSIVSAVKGNGATRVTMWTSTYGVIDRGVVNVTGLKNSHPAYRISSNEYAFGFDAVMAYPWVVPRAVAVLS